MLLIDECQLVYPIDKKGIRLSLFGHSLRLTFAYIILGFKLKINSLASTLEY